MTKVDRFLRYTTNSKEKSLQNQLFTFPGFLSILKTPVKFLSRPVPAGLSVVVLHTDDLPLGCNKWSNSTIILALATFRNQRQPKDADKGVVLFRFVYRRLSNAIFEIGGLPMKLLIGYSKEFQVTSRFWLDSCPNLHTQFSG